MRFDYSERRLESKNKPRRQPAGKYAAGIAVVILLVFASGFAGGWFTCRSRMKKASSVQQTAALPATISPRSLQDPQAPASGQQAPLTFYETLPKGGKGVIGSGINANLKEHPATPDVKPPEQPQPLPVHAKPSPVAPPAAKNPPVSQEKPASVKPPSSPSSPAKAPEPANPPKTPSTKPDGEKKFTVQVASVRDRSEADSLRSKLSAKGLNPMILEVNVPEKGVVFRVRAGRHMLQREAQELAEKLGSGAIVVTE
jgi:cell division septation protein DedD